MGILDDLYGFAPIGSASMQAKSPGDMSRMMARIPGFNDQTGYSPGLLGNIALGLISAGTTPQRVPQSSLNTILGGVAQGVTNYGNQLVANRQLQQQNLTNYLEMQKTGLEMQQTQQAIQAENMRLGLLNNIANIGMGDVNQIIPKLHIADESELANYLGKQNAPFGTGTQGSALNIARRIASKIRNNTATEQERFDYRTAIGVLGKTSSRQIPDEATGQMITVEEKGFTPEELGFPTLGDNQQSTTGETSGASDKRTTIGKGGLIYNQNMLSSALFADRMVKNNQIMNDLELKGYNPGNIKDNVARKSAITNFLSSPEGQVYQNAAMNFVTANLRDESGAAIPLEEKLDEIKKYVPQPGDGVDVIKAKAEARKNLTNGMIQKSGGAYKTLFEKKANKAQDLPDDAKLLRIVNGKEYYQVGDKVMVREVQ